MKQFLAFVLKEFKHIARDRWTLLILLGIPIAQILLFGFAITTEVRSTPTAVYAPRGQAAREITAELEASPYRSSIASSVGGIYALPLPSTRSLIATSIRGGRPRSSSSLTALIPTKPVPSSATLPL